MRRGRNEIDRRGRSPDDRAARARLLVVVAPALAVGFFALDRIATPSSPPGVVVPAEDLARVRRAWTDEHGRAPDAVEERQIATDLLDDAILTREAIALGLDRGDRLVRSRLVELGNVGEGGAGLDLDARPLGLERSDPIISVHLADLLRLALARTDASDVPDDAELARYYELDAARFAQPARIRFAHVYLAHDGRAGRDPVRLREDLESRATDPRDAAALGDPFVHGAEIGPLSSSDIARLFGAEFAAALEAAPERHWTGPISSAYGVHLVWVEERSAGRIPPLEAVRNQVVHAFLRDRGAARLRNRLKDLRHRYRAEIAPGDPSRSL